MTTLKLKGLNALQAEARIKEQQRLNLKPIGKVYKKKDETPKQEKKESLKDLRTPYYDYNKIHHGGRHA